MEKKIKTNCSCFGFLRRKNKPRVNEPARNSSSQRSFLGNQCLENPLEESHSVEHSYSNTQNNLRNISNIRSSIITPSRRTPLLQRLIPNLLTNKRNSIIPENSPSIETEFSRPSTLREIHYNPIIAQQIIATPKSNHQIPELDSENKEINFDYISRIKQSFEDTCIKNKEIYNKSLNEQLYMNNQDVFKEIEVEKKEEIIENNASSSKLDQNQSIQAIDGQIINKEFNLPLVEQPTSKENDSNQQFPFIVQGKSPDFFSNSSRLGFMNDIKMPSLQISPIDSKNSVEDYTDILEIFKNPEKLKQIPDIFIRNLQKPQHLPILKPTTPSYFNKRHNLPIFRQNILIIK